MERRDVEDVKSANERLKSEIEKLRKSLHEEIVRSSAGVRLDLNLEKGRIRDETIEQHDRLRKTDSKIENEILALKRQMEGIKLQILQYMIGTITGAGTLVLGKLQFLNPNLGQVSGLIPTSLFFPFCFFSCLSLHTLLQLNLFLLPSFDPYHIYMQSQIERIRNKGCSRRSYPWITLVHLQGTRHGFRQEQTKKTRDENRMKGRRNAFDERKKDRGKQRDIKL